MVLEDLLKDGDDFDNDNDNARGYGCHIELNVMYTHEVQAATLSECDVNSRG